MSVYKWVKKYLFLHVCVSVLCSVLTVCTTTARLCVAKQNLIKCMCKKIPFYIAVPSSANILLLNEQ